MTVELWKLRLDGVSLVYSGHTRPEIRLPISFNNVPPKKDAPILTERASLDSPLYRHMRAIEDRNLGNGKMKSVHDTSNMMSQANVHSHGW